MTVLYISKILFMHRKKLVKEVPLQKCEKWNIFQFCLSDSRMKKSRFFFGIIVRNVTCKSQKCVYNIYWVFYFIIYWKVFEFEKSWQFKILAEFQIFTLKYYEGILTSGSSYLLTWYMLSSIILGFDNYLENYALCRKSPPEVSKESKTLT